MGLLGKGLLLAIGLGAVLAGFLIVTWTLQAYGVFSVSELFSISNPLGLVAMLGILVFGGVYLFRVGFEVLYGLYRK